MNLVDIIMPELSQGDLREYHDFILKAKERISGEDVSQDTENELYEMSNELNNIYLDRFLRDLGRISAGAAGSGIWYSFAQNTDFITSNVADPYRALLGLVPIGYTLLCGLSLFINTGRSDEILYVPRTIFPSEK